MYKQSYKINIQYNSPTFIGSGEKINKSNYFIDKKNGYVYVLDELAFFKYLKSINMVSQYEKALTQKFFNLNIFIRDNDIRADFESLSRRKLPFDTSTLGGKDGMNDISTFIRNGFDEIFVPGSSVKGAISTAIIHDKINTLEQTDYRKYSSLLEKYKNDRFGNSSREILSAVFDGKQKEYFACIQVTDSLELENIKMGVLQKIDYTTNKSKFNKLSVYRECIVGGSSVHQLSITKEGKDKFGITIEYILNCLENFAKHQANLLKNINKSVDFYNNNLVFGGGTGFINKTFVYSLADREVITNIQKYRFKAFRKHNHDTIDTVLSPRTVKYSGTYNDIQGLCKLSVVEELFYDNKGSL